MGNNGEIKIEVPAVAAAAGPKLVGALQVYIDPNTGNTEIKGVGGCEHHEIGLLMSGIKRLQDFYAEQRAKAAGIAVAPPGSRIVT